MPVSAFPRKNVLVAEDDERINKLLVETLLEGGFAVTSAPDGAEALSHLDQASFDAVILDLVMPGMSALGVMEELRRRKLAMPVFLVSGYIGVLEERRFRELGVAGMFPKPLKFKALVEAVRLATR